MSLLQASLPIEILVKHLDASNFMLDLLPLSDDLLLLIFHPMIHFVKLSLFDFKIAILRLHDLFVLIQEATHVVKLFVLEDLESLEVGSDFIWRWNGVHFGD